MEEGAARSIEQVPRLLDAWIASLVQASAQVIRTCPSSSAGDWGAVWRSEFDNYDLIGERDVRSLARASCGMEINNVIGGLQKWETGRLAVVVLGKV